MSIEITHIRLSGSIRQHEYITHLRWKNENDGSTGDSTKATLVDWIDNKKGVAHVGSGSVQVNVGTVHPDGGTPYLRTYADGKWTNNLLSLPEF
ncbi:DUF3892 domain-containing protein [Promicromonospora sp. NPDC060271]|uniref:DUF3892 domain-containing protein n=1 Tax=Promicromonospora sp. NPDC060271 TaxID=3347089 RepID=UPI00365A4003